MIRYFILFFIVASIHTIAQEKRQDTVQLTADTTLKEVTVFSTKVQWKDAAAAVAVLSKKDLVQQLPNSFLPAVNTIPGIKMEERSPESYRIAIRGSSLRSPFGVRNVKVYWNDIFLSDAGGNTYINLIDLNELSSIEILKGPSASMYGAGTGGVLLLHSNLEHNSIHKNSVDINVLGGSFGLFNESVQAKIEQKHVSSSFIQVHQQSNGYRRQAASKKDIFQWQSKYQSAKHSIDILLFSTNIFYQTPGGLTHSQMMQDPQQARLKTGNIPSAIQQNASVYNKTIFAGLSDVYALNKSLSFATTVMLNHTSFTNPSIFNFENRDETNTGTRIQLTYQHKLNTLSFHWNTGIEWLYNHSRIDDYGNKAGQKDTLQFKDDVYANQWFIFSQAHIQWANWRIEAGVSSNNQSYRYQRISNPLLNTATVNNANILTPRISLLYQLNNHISLYAVAAKGFSPPSLAEIHPSDGIFHSELQPEMGWNVEAGVKGDVCNDKLTIDIAAYNFQLSNAIVRRNNSIGAEYFVNAGNISEKGVEVFLKWQIINNNRNKFVHSLQIQNSFSYQPYLFNNYIQGANNYSNNAVTGVATYINVTALNTVFANNLYCNIMLNINSKIPLNDANSEYANAYHLLQIKLGKTMAINHTVFQIFAGADNVLNELYSLGNDINAAGNRYYNPAASRNFYAGLSCKL